MASQYRSVSAWSCVSTTNETDSLRLKLGPPLSPMKGLPSTVNSTISSIPSAPSGARGGHPKERARAESSAAGSSLGRCFRGHPHDHGVGPPPAPRRHPFRLPCALAALRDLCVVLHDPRHLLGEPPLSVQLPKASGRARAVVQHDAALLSLADSVL